jgi:hypothetical protein
MKAATCLLSMPDGVGQGHTVLGVKGSPVQIRPSRPFFEHLYPSLGTNSAMIVPT